MSKEIQQKTFNYGVLEKSVADELISIRNSVRHNAAIGIEAMLTIGRHIDRAQALLTQEQFEKWVKLELPITSRSARRVRNAFLVFQGESAETLQKIDVSAMYELSSPTASKDVRDRLIGLAKQGEHINKQRAQEELTPPWEDDEDEGEGDRGQPEAQEAPRPRVVQSEAAGGDDNDSGTSQGEQAEYVTDHFGNIIVDPEIADAFALVPELKAMLKEIARINNRIHEIREESAAGRMMTPDICQSLREAHVHLKAAIPYAMPPQEVLDGNNKVSQVGFMTKRQYEALPPELKYENRDD